MLRDLQGGPAVAKVPTTPPPPPDAPQFIVSPSTGLANLASMSYKQLQARFNELQNQRQILADRRSNDANQYRSATGVSRDGIGARLQVMDRSMVQIEGDNVHLACAVEVGHVLRLMRPGDLIGQTARDLAAARARLGGDLAALIAFSCIGRHWDAAARGLEQPLADTYAAYPTIGFQSFGEQAGMLLCNHTLTGLAIGKQARGER